MYARAKRMLGASVLAGLALLGADGCASSAPARSDPKDTPPAAVEGHTYKASRLTMGTLVHITIAAPETERRRRAVDEAFAAIERVVSVMSEWEKDSDISRVNRRAGGQPVRVDASLIEVLEAAHEVSEASDGAFDITWAAMRGLWRFEAGHERVPSDKTLRAVLTHIDYRRVLVDGEAHTVRLADAGMAVGLGGIAKGYAVRKAARALEDAGIDDFLIDAGGDIYAHGMRYGEPWRVGIAHPRRRGDLLTTIALRDAALVTSGDYEHYFIRDGRRYHHIIDPRTGRPARGVVSVSVRCDDPTYADALATAAFVLGPQAGLAFIERWDGAEALIVDSQMRLHHTGGWPR